MPTEYKRKRDNSRGSWTQESLFAAVEAVRSGRMGVNAASRNFGVPAPTLRRRIKNNDVSKKTLGPPSLLGTENENKLKAYIKKLQKYGFAPTRESVRSMAFHLAENLGINHKFNKDKDLAGYDWLNSFLKRNQDLRIRKSEGVSLARCQGMNKVEVELYFQLLERTLRENDLMNKPSNIFNMDETGLQLNNKAGYVIAAKGSKNVAAVTSSEKGETITVISCCNAEGSFLPPACIFKGKNKKAEFEDGMPPGSVVYMNEKSAYISTNLFLNWLKTHFMPRKPNGKVLLILDGHSTHCNSVEMLEYADECGIILLCLPSHTTQFLQPLDRAFFKSLKSYFAKACNLFIKTNPTRKINRMIFGKLLSDAWSKAATVENGVSSFRATGIQPFNPDAIPDYAFLNEEQTEDQREQINEHIEPEPEHPPENPTPGCSQAINERTPVKDTPCTMLQKFNPIPSTSSSTSDVVQKAKKRGKQIAALLTSSENIEKRKSLEKRKLEIEKSKSARAAKRAKTLSRHKPKNVVDESSSEENVSDFVSQESDDSPEDDNSAECIGCGEQYCSTSKQDDWVKCVNCEKWFHDGCSKFVNLCHSCGKVLALKKK